MLYTIIILAALAAIAFFHYLEGLFSATLSAIFAVIAAVVAVGYHELIVESLLGGRFAAESDALVLMILFALTYLILRLVFDRFVKGNVRVPFIVDKIGAAAMGVVAGIFALGVVTIAAEELPFGPDIAGYHRYALSDDRPISLRVSGYRNDQTPTVFGELASDEVGQFDPSQKNHVFPAVDDVVVNTVSWLSHGSLAGKQPLTDIHPDLLQELFAQRLGMEPAANHSALNIASGAQQVSVSAVYTVSSASLTKVFDQYDPKLRAHPLAEIDTIKHLDKEKQDQMLLVVRMKVSPDAADKDGYFRFSPSNIRLVALQRGETNVAPGDYYPIGTLENNKLYVDKPDDYLFLNTGGDRAVDLVFLVDRWAPATQLPPDAFLEVKRLARVDLSNKKIASEPPAQPAVGKEALVGVIHVSSGDSQAPPPPTLGHPTTTPATPPSTPPGTPPGGTPPQPVANGVLDVQDVSFTSDLPQRVGMTAAEAKKPRGSSVNDGQADLRDGQARSLTLSGAVPAAQIAQGEAGVTQLAAPHGQVLLRIHAKAAGDNSWAWVKTVGGLAVVDGAGATHKAKGAWANFTAAGVPHVVATYSSQYDMDVLPALDGVVTDIYIYVPVPPGAVLQQVTLDGKPIKDLQGVNVPQPGQSPQPPQHPQSGNLMAPQTLVPGANGQGLLNWNQPVVSAALPFAITLSAAEAKKPRASVFAGGTANLVDGKAHSLTIDGWPSAADLEDRGDVKVTELIPPAGKVLVQVGGKPGGDNTWAWVSHVKALTVTDANGNAYPPQGVWVSANIAANIHVMAMYDSGYPLGDITPGQGEVTNVYFFVPVPKGAVLKQLMLDGKSVQDLTGLDTSQ